MFLSLKHDWQDSTIWWSFLGSNCKPIFSCWLFPTTFPKYPYHLFYAKKTLTL